MLKLGVIFALVGVLLAQDSCRNVQLGGSKPCEYSTSNCTAGLIQWNYPTGTCKWTFTPKGATSILLKASWRTAEGVNVSFYDGTSPSAKLLGVVIGEGDDASATLVSQTGTLFVRLDGPKSMMTYALIFDYTLTINPDRCAARDGNCVSCLNSGCVMVGEDAACVKACPRGATCWSQSVGVASFDICNARQSYIDTRQMCASFDSCDKCTEGGVCKWGGPVGQPSSCRASCDSGATCEWKSCQNVCRNQTTCEGCLRAGCSVMGMDGMHCMPACPTDVPCWTPPSTCRDRQTLIDKTRLCDSLNYDCQACAQNGCKWNTIAPRGQNCIVECGFFPCEPAKECNAGMTYDMLWGVMVGTVVRHPAHSQAPWPTTPDEGSHIVRRRRSRLHRLQTP